MTGVISTDAAGNLASDGGAFGGQLNSNVDGIAMVFALKAPHVPVDRTAAFTGGFGFFDGNTAFGGGAGIRINPNFLLDVGVSVGFQSGKVGGRVGITTHF